MNEGNFGDRYERVQMAERRNSRLQIVLTPTEHETLRRECEALDISMGQYVRKAVAAYRKQRESERIY